MGNSSWLAPTGGTLYMATEGNTTPDYGYIKWGAGPTNGKAVYKAHPDYVWDLDVSVVEVKLKTGATNTVTYMNPPFQTAVGSAQIRSHGNRAMTARVTIEEMEGPTRGGGGERGKKFIQVGFIQNAQLEHEEGLFNGFAPPRKRVASLVDGLFHLDTIDGSTNPWYDSNGVGIGGGRGVYQPPNDGAVANIALSTGDSPRITGSDVASLTIGPVTDVIDALRIEMPFKLYVGVRTTQNVNGSANVYSQRALASWKFDGNGTLAGAAAPANFGTWTRTTAQNTGDASFTFLASGSVVPLTTGARINDMLLTRTWSTQNQ